MSQEVREVQENAFPVLLLGLALLKPKEELQAALLQTAIDPQPSFAAVMHAREEKKLKRY